MVRLTIKRIDSRAEARWLNHLYYVHLPRLRQLLDSIGVHLIQYTKAEDDLALHSSSRRRLDPSK